MCFPGPTSSKEPTCQCRRCKRCRFDPWVGKIPWRRKWQHTPVILSGKSNGQRNLVGYTPGGCKKSDTTERLHFHFSLSCIGEGNRGSASWLSSHGRGLGPRDALKKDSRGLCRGAAGNPRFPRLLPGTLGNFPGRGTGGGRRKAVRDRFALQGGTGDFP